MDRGKIRDFQDLNAWQYGHKLVLMIYALTEKFPSKERFSLIDQMRRAVVSVTSNIAEGFGRDTAAEKRRFYAMAMGSLTELQNQTIVARDVSYLSNQDYETVEKLSVVVSKLINGLSKNAFDRIHDS